MKEFKAQSKKLLDLVVNSIYVNRDIFLRELISNASDALDKRRFMSLTDASLDADFAIELKADEPSRTLTVSDNGVGMSEKELEDNLGVIAASGTEQFKLERGKTDGEELIGQFGVGFYSAFMVAEKVTVITKKAGETQAFCWESDGVEGFEITPCERSAVGTDIIVKLKPDGEDDDYSQYLKEYRLTALVKKYSDYIRYPIRLLSSKAVEGDAAVAETKVLNSMTPVWKKSKAELGESELDDFYKHTYHDYRPPMHTVSTRVEGAVAYTALLFVPSEPPLDYYTKEYKRGLSLYCNGVLIMDTCEELVPEYLGFVRGVVDTPDLALNISRETLQHDRRLKAIANGLEKKILSEFEKLLKNDREKYDKLFEQFGKAIKFGAYDNFGANKDKLKDILLFYSDAQKKNVTFKEYVAPLEAKASILYACGETVDKIAMMPQLEGARGSGKDVLYFTSPVDEFVARMLEEYDGHKFENVASFAEVKTESEDNKELIKRIETKLAGKAAVTPTDKLKSYPVCLAAKGEISLEMERVMAAMGNTVKADRVLQVNLAHPVVKALDGMEEARFADTVTVLYNEALLAEGYKTEAEFLPALNRLLAPTVPAAKEPEKPVPAAVVEVADKKPTLKKTADKKPAVKKDAEKKPAVKKTVEKKPAVKKTAQKKSADKPSDK